MESGGSGFGLESRAHVLYGSLELCNMLKEFRGELQWKGASSFPSPCAKSSIPD